METLHCATTCTVIGMEKATTAALEKIKEMEELKKDTKITNSVRETVDSLLSLKDVSKITSLELLIKSLNKSYTSMVKSVKRYKLPVTKRDKLWVQFHKFSVQEGYQMCNKCESDLGFEVEATFWQLLMETEFHRNVTKALNPVSSSTSTAYERTELSHIEANAVRYTAGCVIRKLEMKYSKLSTKEGIDCKNVLKGMAGKLSANPELASNHSSNEWTNLVDRGGLYRVADLVYYLFAALELLIDKELTAVFQSKGKGIEKIQKEKLGWVCEDEEVQFIWCMVSPDILIEESVRQRLLRELTFTYIITRCHSKTARLKEDHKIVKQQTMKRKKALRKELAGRKSKSV